MFASRTLTEKHPETCSMGIPYYTLLCMVPWQSCRRYWSAPPEAFQYHWSMPNLSLPMLEYPFVLEQQHHLYQHSNHHQLLQQPINKHTTQTNSRNVKNEGETSTNSVLVWLRQRVASKIICYIYMFNFHPINYLHQILKIQCTMWRHIHF